MIWVDQHLIQCIAGASDLMFGQYEVFIQLALLAMIVLAGPVVIFLLYARGADM